MTFIRCFYHVFFLLTDKSQLNRLQNYKFQQKIIWWSRVRCIWEALFCYSNITFFSLESSFGESMKPVYLIRFTCTDVALSKIKEISSFLLSSPSDYLSWMLLYSDYHKFRLIFWSASFSVLYCGLAENNFATISWMETSILGSGWKQIRLTCR